MSSGDFGNDPYPFTLAVANQIIALPIAARMMRRRYVLDSTHWDIPYLAGYSQDGSVVYIDRDLADWPYLGRMINCDRFLELHEYVEKSLIDALHDSEGAQLSELLKWLRMKHADDEIYYHCHGVATAIETGAVKLQYGASGLASYNHFMRGQIKDAEDERIRRVPRVLDLTPYQGTDRRDRDLRLIMESHMA